MAELLQHLIDALSLGSLYAVIALGVSLIFGIMRLVNFAHGEFIMAGGYVIVFAHTLHWLFLLLAVVGTVVALALIAERLAFRPIRSTSDETMLVTSFALSFLLQNVALLAIGGDPRGVSFFANLSGQIQVGAYRLSGTSVVTTLTAIFLLAALSLFLSRTPIGMQMRAAAEDFRMARLVGVNANRVIASAFAISGVLAAVVSILLVMQTGSVSPTVGVAPMFGGVVAIVLGGIGSLTGAVAGGYVFGASSVLLEATLPDWLRPYRDAFVFAAVIVILLARPQGLIPGRSQETRI